jgi:hypothetical protein
MSATVLFTASCNGMTRLISDTPGRSSRGRFSNGTTGTTPSGFGNGHGSPATSRGCHRITFVVDR